MFFFTAATFLMLGIAALWALRITFGSTRLAANNTLALCISIVGWLLIFFGVSAIVTPFWMILVLIIFGMVVARFRHSERRALLWTLSLAAEKGIPLAPSVRAFAARRSDEMARRALVLADLLDAGVRLPKALTDSGNPLPHDTALMVQLSANSTATAAALRESGEFGDDVEQAWNPIFGQLAYLLLVICFAVNVITFIMVSVIPTYRQIFMDFGTELPAVSRLMIELANLFARYWFLFIPVYLYFIVVSLVAAFFYARGQIWLPPPFHWLFGKNEGPTLLRGLAVCVEQKMPINLALHRLGQDYPDGNMRVRLAECAGATSVGADWCDALQRERLITPAEAAVLKSAAQAGSLSWALRELAEVRTRAMIYRAKAILSIASPISILLMAIPVAFVALGCFLPLVSLIQNLT